MKYADAWEELAVRIALEIEINEAAKENLEYMSDAQVVANTRKQTYRAFADLLEELEREFE